jgi:transcriptional regulator with XRE-family HTH domain
MTTPNHSNTKRDEVLFAFQQACEQPTAQDILDWTQRFPQFADDIRAHAAIARDWAARRDFPVGEPDEDLLARGRSRVLNALYNAEMASKAVADPSKSFQQLMEKRGIDVPQLARELDIARSVLADLVNGGMLAPVGQKLLAALAGKLEASVEALEQAVQYALAAPRLGHAKADGAPTIIARPYDEVVRTSNMVLERKAYWLSDD